MFLNAHGTELDRLEQPEIRSYLPSFDQKTVLDLACGIGRYTTMFAATAKKVVSVDLNPIFIEENQRRNSGLSNIEYLSSDAMEASLPKSQFDLIFISWLFQYLTDQEVEILVDRIATWVKPGGYLFFRETCCPVRRSSTTEGYFALYRNLVEYPEFFSANWTMKGAGNILSYETLFADPFRCYWLFHYRKKGSNFAKHRFS
jgi:phosphoethanolamine N-methyltransferase